MEGSDLHCLENAKAKIKTNFHEFIVFCNFEIFFAKSLDPKLRSQ